jgi:hypothetical protein
MLKGREKNLLIFHCTSLERIAKEKDKRNVKQKK